MVSWMSWGVRDGSIVVGPRGMVAWCLDTKSLVMARVSFSLIRFQNCIISGQIGSARLKAAQFGFIRLKSAQMSF